VVKYLIHILWLFGLDITHWQSELTYLCPLSIDTKTIIHTVSDIFRKIELIYMNY
jgi:hypothetical protein